MAARIRKTSLTETWKAKISATKIVQRLQDHVEGNVQMSPTQVKAAQILLGKLVPDLARSEVTGKDGEALVLKITQSDAGLG